MLTQEEIVEKVSASAKYKYVGRATVEHIVAECVRRYGLKRAEDESKRLLHQVWGIYFEDVGSKLQKIENLDRLLALHTSTRERLPMLREFYGQVFAVTGHPRTIADYGSGLNPLAYASLGLSFPDHYYAFDIDKLTVELLQTWFGRLRIDDRFNAQVSDLLADQPQAADITLLLKVLPPLELQQKGASEIVLDKLRSAFIVVSYPTKSVSGKEKGMENFYRDQFYKIASGKPWKITEISIGSELVLIVEK